MPSTRRLVPKESRDSLVHAGGEMRRRREQYKEAGDELLWSQRGVVDQMARIGHKTSATLISHIEAGEIDKPSMSDLVYYGQVLGMTPNDVAQMYGWWTPQAGKEKDPAIITTIRRLFRTLSPWQREQVERALTGMLKIVLETLGINWS